jgi:hypothetical protein
MWLLSITRLKVSPGRHTTACKKCTHTKSKIHKLSRDTLADLLLLMMMMLLMMLLLLLMMMMINFIKDAAYQTTTVL